MGSALVKMGLLYLNSQDFFDNAAASMGVDDANSCHEIYNLSKAFIVISSIRAVELNIGHILDWNGASVYPAAIKPLDDS